MDTKDKEEYIKAAQFMRQAIRHINKATVSQKQTLLKLLLERPAEDTVTMAMQIWSGLTEKEFMTLCAKLQKQHDKEFWLYATRWR